LVFELLSPAAVWAAPMSRFCAVRSTNAYPRHSCGIAVHVRRGRMSNCKEASAMASL